MARKAPKAKQFDLYYLPVRSGRYTPKQARTWLRKEYPGLQQLLSLCAGVDASKCGFDAPCGVEELSRAVGEMVEAMTTAISEDCPVRVTAVACTMDGDEADFESLRFVLGVVATALRTRDDEMMLDSDGWQALLWLADGAVEYVGEARKAQSERWRKEHERKATERDAASEEDNPNRVGDLLWDRCKEVEAEAKELLEPMRTALEGAIEEALAPLEAQFKRRSEAYTYEMNMHGRAVFGYGTANDPDEEPERYERTEFADLADRSAKMWTRHKLGYAERL